MTDLIKLEKDIELLATDRNSNFFHRIIGDLATLLGFDLLDDWHEGLLENELPAKFPTKLDLFTTYAVSHFNKFRSKREYKKNNEYILSTTTYPFFERFEIGIYSTRSLTSNSLLGLENEVVLFENLDQRFRPVPLKDSLTLALENNCIIKKGPDYYLNPEQLYGLIENKPSD